MLMLGSVGVAGVIIAARNVTAVATTAVEVLSQNGTGKVDYADLHFASDSTMVIFPQILQDAAQKGISWKNDISVSMAGVCFGSSPTICAVTGSCEHKLVRNCVAVRPPFCTDPVEPPGIITK